MTVSLLDWNRKINTAGNPKHLKQNNTLFLSKQCILLLKITCSSFGPKIQLIVFTSKTQISEIWPEKWPTQEILLQNTEHQNVFMQMTVVICIWKTVSDILREHCFACKKKVFTLILIWLLCICTLWITVYSTKCQENNKIFFGSF